MVRDFLAIVWTGLAMIFILLSAIFVGFVVGDSDKRQCRFPTHNQNILDI